jgi:hypothetical protein
VTRHLVPPAVAVYFRLENLKEGSGEETYAFGRLTGS